MFIFRKRIAFNQLVSPIPDSVEIIDVDSTSEFIYYEFNISHSDLYLLCDKLNIGKPEEIGESIPKSTEFYPNRFKGRLGEFFRIPLTTHVLNKKGSEMMHLKYDGKIKKAYLIVIYD